MLRQANKRPYIILNDKSSMFVKGLLITELPPITKAKLRTKTETIDGRDGDLITELGYSAYDKAVKFALTYDYDIDDVISFFTSSGRVVFSNEPDKYYRYNVYDKIDFDRLIRFKKGKVNFHVQPFKYSDNEAQEDYLFTKTNGIIKVINQGNYYSRPKLIITGVGTVELSINDVKILTINFGNTGRTMIIDSEAMNATSYDGAIFLNRLVSGNYDNIRLKSGENKISFNGIVSKISLSNRSRWL